MINYEIERKFLLNKDLITHDVKKGNEISQGYLFVENNKQIRVRIIGNTEAFLCYKEGSGLKREEIEFQIPLQDAQKLLSKAIIIVNKIRTNIDYKGKKWDIDYYPNLDLLIGEVELNDENEKIELLNSVIKEVTGEKEYSNINLGIKKG